MRPLRQIIRHSDIPDAALCLASLQQGAQKVSTECKCLINHFNPVLFSEFDHCLHKKKCPQCRSSFDTETKLLMHLGCTHREVIWIAICQLTSYNRPQVHKYLPSNAKELMPGTRTPTKIMKPPIRGPAPAPDMFQKFASNLVKG